jgi:hypothetical protein
MVIAPPLKASFSISSSRMMMVVSKTSCKGSEIKRKEEENVCQVEVTHEDDENVLDPMLNA